MATTKDKRKVSGPGKTCVSCRNGKVKCKRPDQADGLPLPDCNRCVQKHRVCVVYVEDKRKNDTQRRQVTAKRAEMEKTCVGFLTLFAILHYFDGVLPRHIARMHLESLLDVVPKICSLTAVSEFRARLGFLESKDHPLAEQAKKICDLVVDSQDEVPAGGSKLEKVRQCTRQRARGACRLYAAFSRLLFRYVQALMDFEYQGEVQRDLAELHFEISISDENAIAFVYNGTKEELDRVLESIETGMELQETPSKGRLEKAQTEAMAVYGTGTANPAADAAAAVQPAQPQPGAAPDHPIVLDEEIAPGAATHNQILVNDNPSPDAEEPPAQNLDNDGLAPLQNGIEPLRNGVENLTIQYGNLNDFDLAAFYTEPNLDPALAQFSVPDNTHLGVDEVPALDAAAAAPPVPGAELPAAPDPTVGAVADFEDGPQNQQLLRQQQQEHFLLPGTELQPQPYHYQAPLPHQQPQAGNHAMLVNNNPYQYTQSNTGMGMGVNMGTDVAGWQPQYQQPQGYNSAYGPYAVNTGMNFGFPMPQQPMVFNSVPYQQMVLPHQQMVMGQPPMALPGQQTVIPQQQMALPGQQMRFPAAQQQQNQYLALNEQLQWVQQNAGRYAHPQ